MPKPSKERHSNPTNHVKEAQQIHIEIELYEQEQVEPETAHFLVTHPKMLRKWKDDFEYQERFNF